MELMNRPRAILWRQSSPNCEPAGRRIVTDERWPRVKALFQSASDRPAGERDAFLAAATGEDEALRREVESLLTWDASDASVLDPPPPR